MGAVLAVATRKRLGDCSAIKARVLYNTPRVKYSVTAEVNSIVTSDRISYTRRINSSGGMSVSSGGSWGTSGI